MNNEYSYRDHLNEIKERYGSPLAILRAQELGFGFSEIHNAYIRMSWEDEKKRLVNIEVCPPGKFIDISCEMAIPKDCIKWLVDPMTGKRMGNNSEIKKAFLLSLPIPKKEYVHHEFFQVNINKESEYGN